MRPFLTLLWQWQWATVASCCSGEYNDDACNAELAALGVPVAWDNTGATAQADEVTPGSGTNAADSCLSQDGWCDSDPFVDNSVWFKFVSVTSTCVTIRLDSENDMQLALYRVNNAPCANCNRYVEIAANDDSESANDDSEYDSVPFIQKASVLPD
jgi:hypothetical protein